MEKLMSKKILMFIILIFLLISCYSHKIILNQDKNSGEMIIEYYLDDDYFQLLSIAMENVTKKNEEKSNYCPASVPLAA